MIRNSNHILLIFVAAFFENDAFKYFQLFRRLLLILIGGHTSSNTEETSMLTWRSRERRLLSPKIEKITKKKWKSVTLLMKLKTVQTRNFESLLDAALLKA